MYSLNVEKIIWLDSDTIVTKSLTSFWEADFEGNLISGVDPAAVYYDWLPIERRWRIVQHIRRGSIVVNTGVIKYNLKDIRKDTDCSISHIEQIITSEDGSIFDRGVIEQLTHKLYARRVQQVDVVYNFESPLAAPISDRTVRGPMDIDSAKYYSRLGDAVIIHYTSLKKPWSMKEDELYNNYISRPWLLVWKRLCDHLGDHPLLS